ncbi:TPA: glycosyltransferase [Clostridium botulinum]|uniref:glycosyltransferase family 2 protein n=1 Tax=Clostridium TaxID=1485 RepID=UPI0007743795|nr:MULTISPECIES: glycosyltransferase [Clostridium]AUM96479.1 glycosyl transferase family 2 [Clostridium sporogenes]AVQ53931.1 glycosyltransferase family 2 protein [Clostridium botulinum]HBJ2614904.1 glycosyltransferase [Clostridium botulinum]
MNNSKKLEPLISIIMPVYNCQEYIEKAINSVIAQTYKSWELIVIDDESKDNTIKIIEKLSNKDQRIRFYKNEKNLGVSETRNKGISLANGEWIAFLDSDDMWKPSKLEKQIIISNTVEAEFIFTGSSFINENGIYYEGILEVPEKVNYKKLRNHNVISCSSVLIKKKFFKDIRMEKDDMHEDYAVWLRVLNTGVCAYGINEPLIVYRISPNSKSGKKIRTIKMTYKVFRFIGMNPVASAYFMCRHIMGSINKYRKIKC